MCMCHHVYQIGLTLAFGVHNCQEHLKLYVCMYVYVCACICVCVKHTYHLYQIGLTLAFGVHDCQKHLKLCVRMCWCVYMCMCETMSVVAHQSSFYHTFSKYHIRRYIHTHLKSDPAISLHIHQVKHNIYSVWVAVCPTSLQQLPQPLFIQVSELFRINLCSITYVCVRVLTHYASVCMAQSSSALHACMHIYIYIYIYIYNMAIHAYLNMQIPHTCKHLLIILNNLWVPLADDPLQFILIFKICKYIYMHTYIYTYL